MDTKNIETKSPMAELFLRQVTQYYLDYRQFRTTLRFHGEEYHSNVMTLRQMVKHLNEVSDDPQLSRIEGRKLFASEWSII